MSFWLLEPKKLIPKVFTITDFLNTFTYYLFFIYLIMILTKHKYINHKIFIFSLLLINSIGLCYEYLKYYEQEEDFNQILDFDLKFD